MRRGAVALLLLVGMWLSACADGAPPPAAPIVARPAAAPVIVPPPLVDAGSPALLDEGVPFERAGSVHGSDGPSWLATVDYGDGGGAEPLELLPGGRFALRHLYAGDGEYTVTVTVAGSGGRGVAVLPVTVAPLRVVFIAGLNSEGGCGGGADAHGQGPGWVREALAGARTPGLAVGEAADFIAFSYSGRWCGGGDGSRGERADYSGGDTCTGIDGPGGSAARLRSLVESLGAGRVMIAGHSMGGLIAAHLAGSDPAWARAHIASIVTFDAPLGGVPRVNLTLLRMAGNMGGGCDFDSEAMHDLEDGGNPVLKVARVAAGAVPMYTIDSTKKDDYLRVLRQAVPGDRTHIEGERMHEAVDEDHQSVWTNAGQGRSAAGKAALLRCALAAGDAVSCAATAGTMAVSR
ncbi:MAG: hypothetical protein ACR2HN_00750 [Tepidiformaceae bacterium]